MNGIIFDIKEFALGDGDGIRTTVFLKGCPLRCIWCHNPEGLSALPELYVKKSTCTGCGLCQRECDHPECQPFGRCIHICPKDLVSVAGKEWDAKALADKLEKFNLILAL
jgi:pyruvate formate lyase activating enzyme